MFTFANSSLYAAAFSIAISTALFATAIIPASPAAFA
ncbi:recombination protein F [Erythrobacter sp. SN021]|nr:recombination protein F [Erythrobacter sp. SN021]MCF8882638.1 recombination protein F [Erythrobacter sp. SN021]